MKAKEWLPIVIFFGQGLIYVLMAALALLDNPDHPSGWAFFTVGFVMISGGMVWAFSKEENK